MNKAKQDAEDANKIPDTPAGWKFLYTFLALGAVVIAAILTAPLEQTRGDIPTFNRSAIKGEHAQLLRSHGSYGGGLVVHRFASTTLETNLAAAQSLRDGVPGTEFVHIRSSEIDRREIKELLLKDAECKMVFIELNLSTAAGNEYDRFLHALKGLLDGNAVQCKIVVLSTVHSKQSLSALPYGRKSTLRQAMQLGGMGDESRIYHCMATFILERFVERGSEPSQRRSP